MLRAHERLAKSVLRQFGQDAFLIRADNNQSIPLRASVRFGVETQDAGGGVFERDVGAVLKTDGAKVGDVLEHPDGRFKLDAKLQDNGYTARFTLQKMEQ
jgi:hypothetical protein